MNTTPTELVETGDKRAGNGRCLTTAERRSELVATYRQGGLTMAAFARREGVRYSTFAGWVQQDGRRRAPAGLEVRLMDGTLVRGSAAAEVAALVRALRI